MRIALTVVALAFLSACTADKDDQQTDSVPFLIDWDPEPTYLGIYYAKSSGIFEKAGFNVDIVSLRGANAVVQAVANGANPIGTASGGATVIGASNGNLVLSTAVLYPQISTVVYGPAAKGIEKPSDLLGKRIAIYPTSITKDEFEAFRRSQNLPADGLKIIDAVGSDLEFLAQGQADAVLNYAEMSPMRLASDPAAPQTNGARIFELRLSEFGVTGYGLNIVVSPSEYKKDPDRLKALSNAAVQGYVQGCQRQDEAVEAFLTAVHRTTDRIERERPYVTESWKRICTQLLGKDVGAQTKDGWAATIATYSALGLLPKSVTPEMVLAP